jgi:hypothetical protein
MLSLIFEEDFYLVWAKKIFYIKLLRCVCSDLYAQTEHIGQELMCTQTRTISMSISFLIFQSGCTELARQELMRPLSIRVRDHSESIL